MAVSRKLATELGIDHGDVLSVACGQSTVDNVSVVVQDNIARDRLHLSSDLLLGLSLSVPIRLRVKPPASGTLRLGPFIGILARSTRSARELFMNQTAYFAALIRTGRHLGLPTYVVTPESIDWERRRVRAWSVQGSAWYRLDAPIPDIIYDRVQTRRLDLLPSTQLAKDRLTQLGDIKIFNTGFLDKWDTHEALSTEETQRYLPETRLLAEHHDLTQFTRRYHTTYIKPAGGSLGQGIYVVQRRGGRRFHVTHYGTQKVSRYHVRSLTPVWNRLKRARLRRRYVVQQGLHFARYRGCRFDMRLLAQKGADNEWKITAMYARVAPPGSLRANLDAGGKAVRSSRVLRRIFGRGGSKVSRRIVNAGLGVAQAIESKSQGTLGELGIDIGVDRAGRPWVIEANSKPLRQMEGPARRLARTLRRPLRYAQYLSGF